MAVLYRSLSIFVGIFLLCLIPSEIEGSVQCLNNDGQPVDWFIAYKRDRDYAFYYMDATNPSIWKLMEEPRTLKNENQAVGHTLNQIYSKKKDIDDKKIDFVYGMYSDQVLKGQTISSTYGHTKGVVGFDKKTGFWLVHSIPCFPQPASYDIAQYCAAEKSPRFAQTLLCMSLNTETYMNTIGQQLLYNNAYVYRNSYSDHFKHERFSNMISALEKDNLVRGSPCTNFALLKTLGGETFYSYAKCNGFGKDLYLDWLAPTLGESLYVETWRRGHKLPSQRNGKLWVYNVEYVQFPNVANYKGILPIFKYTKDHSKWAITEGNAIKAVCIGDINRESSQFTRGGGTVCVQHDAIWGVFRNMIKDIEKPGATTTAKPGDTANDDSDSDLGAPSRKRFRM